MELDEFIKKIKEILEDNFIKYFFVNVGHIQILSENKSLLYFTKDLMIFFLNDNCVIDIQFVKVDDSYRLKEMTITIDDEDYGYRHCIMKHKSDNKYREFELNTELDSDSLEDVIGYIINCIKYSNDLESLRSIWNKSLKRIEYKKKYPNFNIDKATYIDDEKLEELEETFDCMEYKNGQIIFFYDDNQINFNYV